MKKSTRYEMQDTRYENGSALILVVVLTSLLAIVGVMFVMVARVDRIATSAISENKTLDSAVEVVIAKISQELALDVPRSDSNGVKLAEYYDYPGPADRWLASLEPYEYSLNNYRWRQISDVYNKLGPSLELDAEIIADYQDNVNEGLQADADGDGVADSKWIELEGINSSKGKTIFAAVRIIDNGGMLNVNTAYKFDPNETDKDLIDGSSQMQINLMAFSWGRYHTTYNSSAETDLLEARANYGIGVNPMDLYEYEHNVVWRYNEPNGRYTPFDISDELELRYRFLINHADIDTRLEELGVAQGWSWEFRTIYDFRTPAETGDLDEWFISSYDDGSLDPNYTYRHIGTTCNMDRIINPYGGKMVNVNTDGAGSVYNAIRQGIDVDPTFYDVNEIAAQIAVNLIDYRDNDSDVTPLPDVNGITYYGFERPCVYISELAHKFVLGPPGPPPITYRSYAIELYKPYSEDNDPNSWRLVVGGSTIDINNWVGNEQFYVIQDQDSNALLDVNLGVAVQDATFAFTDNTEIRLERPIPGGGYITADWYKVDPCLPVPWLSEDSVPHRVQRDIQPHKCIRRLWATVLRNNDDELGTSNSFVHSDPNVIQAHPENRAFTNVGEIGMVFRKGAYYQNDIDRPDRIGYGLNKDEEQVRLDLADPNYQQIFNYLTVFDPTRDGINNDGDDWTNEDALNQTPEWKIPGRININTAPWYVIAQLPWMTDKIAQAIVAYRDKAVIPDQSDIDYDDREAATGIYGIREEAGFASIGELATVVNDPCDPNNDPDYSMHYYILGGEENDDLAGFPDLTPGDDAADDFEERNVIFARLSNLVTVRSDVFTAYILVRIGADGPQKRVMAILDRSNVYSDDGRVQIVALHPVADPR